eukprot:scaffold309172_cov15-Tisochrysis_lutea.AAC.1
MPSTVGATATGGSWTSGASPLKLRWCGSALQLWRGLVLPQGLLPGEQLALSGSCTRTCTLS